MDAMAGKLALIVDDEQAIRAHLKLFLQQAGFHTLEAANGVEALETLRKLGPVVDVLVSDVLMPQMDGVALARAVRAEFPRTPLILFSGYINTDQMRGLNVEFLRKPFLPAVLMDAIARVMAANTPRKAPQSETQPSRSQWGADARTGG